MSSMTDMDRLDAAFQELSSLAFAASEYVAGILNEYNHAPAGNDVQIHISSRQRDAAYYLVTEVSERVDAVRAEVFKLIGDKGA